MLFYDKSNVFQTIYKWRCYERLIGIKWKVKYAYFDTYFCNSLKWKLYFTMWCLGSGLLSACVGTTCCDGRATCCMVDE